MNILLWVLQVLAALAYGAVGALPRKAWTIGVHLKYRESASVVMSGALGLLMAFVAYGRMVLQPIV